MKTIFNLTTNEYDLARFENSAALDALLRGFDGLELMYMGEDTNGILEGNRVVGFHSNFCPYWVDFFNGDVRTLVREFGSLEFCQQFYGGADASALVARFKTDLALAERFGAEYIVFHISDVSLEETFTGLYHHSDAEVVDASAELINRVFDGYKGRITLLMENLWSPGLTLLNSETTGRLLNAVEYKNKGIMLDTGHLMHTHTKLRTQHEALMYILRILEINEKYLPFFRGIHLHQSLTGEYTENVRAYPPKLSSGFFERLAQSNIHVMRIDTHKPFITRGLDKLISTVSPEYLNFEFITENLEQHKRYLHLQRVALNMDNAENLF